MPKKLGSPVVLSMLRTDWRKRCRAWLAKSHDPQSLHPRKKHRSKAKAWLHGLDHQIRTSISFDGFAYFCVGTKALMGWPLAIGFSELRA